VLTSSRSVDKCKPLDGGGVQQVLSAVGGGSWAAVSNGCKAALLLVLTRCVYPGIARALMLEVFTLALHPLPGFVVTVAAVLGGVGLPTSRVAYRLWYVSSHRRGSWWGPPHPHPIKVCSQCTGTLSPHPPASSSSSSYSLVSFGCLLIVNR
jgi:hypothetical protein